MSMVKSMVTGKQYEPREMVRIVNLMQVEKYLKHEATVYDVYISRHMAIFIFSKEETKDLYDAWCKHELD